MLVVFFLLAVCCVAGEEHIGWHNLGQLTEPGCVLLRFHAPWCPACQASVAAWEEAQRHETLRFACRFASVNVDENSGLGEAFGVALIPSLFVYDAARDGICRLTFTEAPTVDAMVAQYEACMAGDEERWERGIWKNPLSSLWLPVLRIGYAAEFAHRFMTSKGLSTPAQVAVAIAALSLLLAIWGFLVYWLLFRALARCCNGQKKVKSIKPKKD